MKNSIENIIKDPNILEGVAWKYRQFLANEIIVHKGETGKSFFFIEEGRLRVTVHIEVEERRKLLIDYLDKHPVQGYLFFKQLFETLITRMNSGIHKIESLMAWGLKAHGISKHL